MIVLLAVKNEEKANLIFAASKNQRTCGDKIVIKK